MSKSILTIAATSVISMLAGVALTLVFTAEALDTLPDDNTDPLREVAQELRMTQTRLGRVERVMERELSATRRDVRDTLNSRTVTGASSRPTSSGAAPGDAVAATATHVSHDGAEPVAGKNLSALGMLEGFTTSANVRSEWLFATERASLDAFGAPDEVSVRGTSEWWTYWNVSGDSIPSEYRLKFNNGRLVDASLVAWKKPRDLPTAAR